MNEDILKKDGLSIEKLEKLSFQSKLGIRLKKNLHYFDKKALFAELEENEQTRTTATTQVEKPLYTANNLDNVFLQDAVRKQITKKLINITDKQYNNGSIIVSKNIYEFTDPTALITYQKGARRWKTW